MKKLLLMLILLETIFASTNLSNSYPSINDYTCANPKQFSIIYTTNKHGNIVLIGNTNICKMENGKCVDPGDEANNNIYAHNKDGDDNIDTDNSSAALLNLPEGSKVLWAGLYWQGYLANSDVPSKQQLVDKIDFGYTPDLKNKDVSYKEIKAQRLNHVYFSNDRWYYQGFADVTDYVKEHGNGWYWGANIITTLGQPKGGALGAWSLAVVYENPKEKFRNLTIFDGYISLASNNDITNAKSYAETHGCDVDNTGLAHETEFQLSGFYAPPSGEVDSRMTFFAGEGDIKLTGDNLWLTNKKGDYIQIYNSVNPINNIANSSISDYGSYRDSSELYPVYGYNTIGIDIDTFNISNIIQNSQTSTKVKLNTTGDGYFPGLVGLAIELYVPNVCYYGLKFYDEDGKELSEGQEVPVGSEIYTVFNIKNSGNEIAKKVIVKNVFDDNITEYVPNSTEVKNVGDNEFIKINDGEQVEGNLSVNYNNNTKEWTVGYLGDSDFTFLPESLNPDYNATIKFKTQIQNDGNITFNFHTTYKYVIANIEYPYDDVLPPCEKENNYISAYMPESAEFNVVNNQFSGNTDPLEPKDPKNLLYTQIVNQQFNVKLLHMDNNGIDLKPYSGLIQVSVIDETNATTKDELDQKPDLAVEYLQMNNKMKELQIKVPKAVKRARFRIRYIKDSKGMVFRWTNMTTCQSQLQGGQDMTMSCIWMMLASEYGGEALNCQIRPTDPGCYCSSECNYGNALTGRGGNNLIKQNSECMKCLFGHFGETVYSRDDFSVRPKKFKIVPLTSGKLKSGNNYTFKLEAVDANGQPCADYNETLNLNAVSPMLDYNDTKANIGCQRGTLSIANPNSAKFADGVANVVLNYNEVGELNMTLKEVDGSEFASVDSQDTTNPNGVKIEAYNKLVTFIPDHFQITTPTYNDGGNGFTYMSNDLNMSSILTFNIKALNAYNQTTINYRNGCYSKNVGVVVHHGSVPVSENLIFKEANETTIHSVPNSQDIVFNVISAKFAGGIANVKTMINFEKKYSRPESPFTFTLNDLNATDTDMVSGVNTINQSANFIYGRINIPNVASYSNVIHNSVTYQYYKNGKWVVNTYHTSNDGNITKTLINGVTSVLGPINSGYQDVKYTSTKSLPYTVKGEYGISSWMWYHPKAVTYLDPSATNHNCTTHPCNKIEFLPVAGGWAGVGESSSQYAPDKNRTIKLKSHADINASKSQVRTINW